MPTVLEAMGQFLDVWIGLVIALLIFYLFKFLFMFGGENEEQRKKRKEEWAEDIGKIRAAMKKNEEAQKEAEKQARERQEKERKARKDALVNAATGQKKKEAERQGEVAQKEQEKREKAQSKVNKFAEYLIEAVAALDEAIKALPDEKEAKKWVAKSKRLLTKVRDLGVLEELTKGTSYEEFARLIHANVVRVWQNIDQHGLAKETLQEFNRHLGAAFKGIGTLIEDFYGAGAARKVKGAVPVAVFKK